MADVRAWLIRRAATAGESAVPYAKAQLILTRLPGVLKVIRLKIRPQSTYFLDRVAITGGLNLVITELATVMCRRSDCVKRILPIDL